MRTRNLIRQHLPKHWQKVLREQRCLTEAINKIAENHGPKSREKEVRDYKLSKIPNIFKDEDFYILIINTDTTRIEREYWWEIQKLIRKAKYESS